MKHAKKTANNNKMSIGCVMVEINVSNFSCCKIIYRYFTEFSR